jgi:hypothetical protein
MSDFPLGVTAPEGAQKIVDVCKGTWAVIEDRESELDTHNRAVVSYTAAVEELNEMGVHVNNAGEFPVFTLGVKGSAYDPSSRVAGAPFLNLSETVELSTLTNVVDLSEYRKLLRCNVLVLHRTKGASDDNPSRLYKLCGKEAAFHIGGQHFCAVHKQSMRTHADDTARFTISRQTLLPAVPSLGWLSHALWQWRILRNTAKRSVPPLGRR